MRICPYCGYNTDKASSVFQKADYPNVGDISFCINCGNISKFTRSGLKKVDETTLPVPTIEEIAALRRAWREMRSQQNELN